MIVLKRVVKDLEEEVFRAESPDTFKVAFFENRDRSISAGVEFLNEEGKISFPGWSLGDRFIIDVE